MRVGYRTLHAPDVASAQAPLRSSLALGPASVLTVIGRCLSIVVYGACRTGKTMWARPLGSHIYCVGLLSGDECMKAEYADYVVFDDFREDLSFSLHSRNGWGLECTLQSYGWGGGKRISRK